MLTSFIVTSFILTHIVIIVINISSIILFSLIFFTFVELLKKKTENKIEIPLSFVTYTQHNSI